MRREIRKMWFTSSKSIKKEKKDLKSLFDEFVRQVNEAHRNIDALTYVSAEDDETMENWTEINRLSNKIKKEIVKPFLENLEPYIEKYSNLILQHLEDLWSGGENGKHKIHARYYNQIKPTILRLVGQRTGKVRKKKVNPTTASSFQGRTVW